MKNIYQQLGQKIRSSRLERDLSQEKFSDICGLHRTYLGGIERGERNPSLENLVKIAEAFQITLSELFSKIK